MQLEDLFNMGQAAQLYDARASRLDQPRAMNPNDIVNLYTQLGGKAKPGWKDMLGAIVMGSLAGAATPGRGDDPSAVFRSALSGFNTSNSAIGEFTKRKRQSAMDQMQAILANDKNASDTYLDTYRAQTERSKQETERIQQEGLLAKYKKEQQDKRYYTLPSGSVLYDADKNEFLGRSAEDNIKDKHQAYKALFPNLSDSDLAAVMTGNAPAHPRTQNPVNPKWQIYQAIAETKQREAELDPNNPEHRAEMIRLHRVRNSMTEALSEIAKAEAKPTVPKPVKVSAADIEANRKGKFRSWLGKELVGRKGDTVELIADVMDNKLSVPPEYAVDFSTWANGQGGTNALVIHGQAQARLAQRRSGTKPVPSSTGAISADELSAAVEAINQMLSKKVK